MRVILYIGLALTILITACAGPPRVREAEYPINCKKGQTIKDLIQRGDAHRDKMMPEKPTVNVDPKQWTQIREIHGVRARICYQLVLDAKPDHPYALLNVGFTHLVRSTYPDLPEDTRVKALVGATDYIQKALNAQRLDAQAYYYLGEIAARRGQCDKAVRIFKSLLSSRWSYSQVYAWMGYCHETGGRPKEAAAAYQESVDISNPIEMGEWARSRIK